MNKGEEENLVPASWSSSAAYVCSPLNHPLTLLHSRDQDTDLGLREGPFSLPSFSMMPLVLETLYALLVLSLAFLLPLSVASGPRHEGEAVPEWMTFGVPVG